MDTFRSHLTEAMKGKLSVRIYKCYSYTVRHLPHKSVNLLY